MSNQPAHDQPDQDKHLDDAHTTHSFRVHTVYTHDYDKFQIEFPSIPLHVTSDKENLDHAKVVIHLLNGAVVRGQLIHFLAAHEKMIILRESDLKAIDVPAEKIRYVVFRQHLSTPNNTHPLKSRTEEAIIPHSIQPYHVFFKDGAKLHGKTFTSSIDMAGLHFFQVIDNHHVARIFIPIQTIKAYHIGAFLGEELLKNKTV